MAMYLARNSNRADVSSHKCSAPRFFCVFAIILKTDLSAEYQFLSNAVSNTEPSKRNNDMQSTSASCIRLTESVRGSLGDGCDGGRVGQERWGGREVGREGSSVRLLLSNRCTDVK